MSPPDRALLEAFLRRDQDLLETSVRSIIENVGLEDAAMAVLQLAVVATAPSVHSRSALLAATSVVEMILDGRGSPGHLVSAAIYSSETRAPWSEPPVASIPEPKELSSADAAQALETGDRESGERWLAWVAQSGSLDAMKAVALALPGAEGWGVTMTSAALRICGMVPEAAHYQVLLVALDSLIGASHSEMESIEEGIRSFLDSPDPLQFLQLESAVWAEWLSKDGARNGEWGYDPYRFAQDFGACPRLWALVTHSQVGDNIAAEVADVVLSLEKKGETWEEWSFA